MNWFYRKSVCTVVTTVFTAVQVLAYAPAASADVITDYAAQGSQYGKDSRNWFLNNLPSLNGKTMTIKGQNGQTVTIDNTDNMAGSQNASSSRFPVETTAQGMEDLKSMAGDYKTQQDTAAERKNYVMGMIQKLVQGDSDAQVTIENTVYSLIDDLASSKQPDYSEDVMWQMTRSILENLTEHAEDLATCDSETTSVTKDVLVHKPNEVTCQQVLDRTGECELTHDYEVLPVISIAEGASANILSCGRGCTQTWLGRVGDNYLDGGSCSLFNFDIYYRVNIPDAIVKIELDYAKFDDQIELYLGPKGSEEFILRMPLDTFPYDYDGTRNGNRCELSTSWVWDPTGLSSRDSKYPSGARVGKYTAPIDVTKYFKNAKKGDIVRFWLRDAIGDKGEAFIRMVVYYDPNKIASDYDEWGPTSCMDVVTGIFDGVAEGSFTCVDMPELDSDGCTANGLSSICEDNLNPSPFDDISALCRKVKVSGNFTFYKGDTGCWQGYMGSDENGNPIFEEVCGGENVGGNLDTCKEYEEQGCTFLGSQCTDGMVGASGNCYVADLTYDCGTDEVVGKTTLETDYTCTGIRCLGTECAEATETKSTDFAKVNAMLNMIDNAGQDMDCTGTDEDGNITGVADVTCQVFKGTKGECKIAVGGWQNCCKENSTTPSMHTYIKTMRSVSAAEATSKGISKMLTTSNFSVSNLSEGIAGAGMNMMWQLAGQYVSFINKDVGNIIQAVAVTPDFVWDGASWLMDKAFAGASENIAGLFNKATSWAKDLFKPVSEFMTEIKKKIAEQIEKLLTELIDKLFPKGAGAAGGGTSGYGGDQMAKAGEKAIENLGQKAGEQAAANSGIMSAIGTAVMVVGYIYMAYMVAKMIVTMIYACEEEEMETVSKIAVKGCHYVGSYCKDKVLGVCIMKKKAYCCFSSPLGRIVNEQIRLQYDEVEQEDGTKVKVPRVQDWGDAKNPNCEGVSVEDMNKIDWDAIDLTEWTHILETNNLSMEQEKGLTMESTTGEAEAVR